jgi:beta-glucosidase
VTTLGTAYVRGLQGDDLSDPLTVLATPKHFVGDGGAAWGTSTSRNYKIDQGVTGVDEAALRAVHLPPYVDAIDAGAMSVMVSFSSWGGMKMHAQKYLISDVLKGELGFEGLVISDWAGIDQISRNYYDAVVIAINAGIDMNMVPSRYDAFISSLTAAVKKGDVPQERVNDAVRRILTVKFQLGLFERPFADPSLLDMVGSDEHRALAREAVNKSLVLLKNDNAVLPIAKDAPLILVAGALADDIGAQCGGWTIEWQGKIGDITQGTTILEGIEGAVSQDTTVQFDPRGDYEPTVDENGQPALADVGIVVVGEKPYAEGVGDKADLALSAADVALIERVGAHSQKVVVILISGRPMIVTEQLAQVDAFVAAWLPGTEGQGVADVLFGDVPFSGRLPFTWPHSMEQIPFDFDDLPVDGRDAPLFPLGYGLDTESGR